jgi:hypothetical protein
MPRVADAMLTRPVLHGRSTTVGELEAFFEDDHVHMALVVDGDRLLAVVERGDLHLLDGDAPAGDLGFPTGRAFGPDADPAEAGRRMTDLGVRRLAMVTDDGKLVGLLCRKASGRGFCADGDVERRRLVTAATGAAPW